MWTNPFGSILKWNSPAGAVTINNDFYGPAIWLNRELIHKINRDGIGSRVATAAETAEAKHWAERQYATWSDYCI